MFVQACALCHRACLRPSGIVREPREGYWVHFSLTAPADETIRRVLGAVSAMVSCCDVSAEDRARLAARLAAASAAEAAVSCCVPSTDAR